MTELHECAFQRARRPEQREARRQAILDAAAAMLGEMPVSDISLRELSRRVGLAKSNVLRYFESREAVFLELLDRSWREWLDALDADLSCLQEEAGGDVLYVRVAEAFTASLVRRPLMCELASVLSSVLERNVSVDAVRTFKLGATDLNARLSRLISERIPELDDDAALELVSTLSVFVAGLWPFANPSPAVVAATQDPCLASSRVDFGDSLTRAFTTVTAGLLSRERRVRDAR